MTISLKADAGGTFGTLQVGGVDVLILPKVIPNYADDTAAAAGGVPIGGLYRTGSALKVRVA